MKERTKLTLDPEYRNYVKSVVMNSLSGWGENESVKSVAFIRGYVRECTNAFRYYTIRTQTQIVLSVCRELVKEGKIGRCLTKGKRKQEVHGFYLE